MTRLERFLVDKWEFSPEWVIHSPTSLFYTFLSIKSGHPLFFTNVSHDYKNSDINNSGKMEVYRHLDEQYIPKTIFVAARNKDQDTNLSALNFPIIAKPNIGKRGLSAALLKDQEELSTYVNDIQVDFLLQEYIDYSNECGIFYIRQPDETRGRITSIGLKTLKTLKGNGTSTLSELLSSTDSTLSEGSALHHYDLDKKILAKDEELVIEPIGSHNRGTSVRSGDHLITESLVDTIEKSLGDLELYYGRLDIKYNTWESLLKGDFKIIEINTITSEPLSIYDPSFGLVKKYRTIYHHISQLQKISSELKKQGRKRMSISEFNRYIKSYKKHLKLITPQKS